MTVTEPLAFRLPLILIDVIPGQETGNADYVITGNAGDLARDSIFEGLKEKGALVIVPSSAVDTMNLGELSSMVSLAQ